MDWLRLWHDMPTDPKWRVVAKKAKQPIPCVIAVYIMMMTNASANIAARGTLLSWDDEDAAAALDMEPEDVAAIRSAMQGKVLEGDMLTGWDRRQPKRERDESGASTERSRKHRSGTPADAGERPETPANATDADATPCNAMQRGATHRGEEIRGEERQKESDNRNRFAFAGSTIRVDQEQFAAWAKAFHAIPDLNAQLTALDGWFGSKDEECRAKWFHSTPSMLNKSHKEALAANKPPDKKRERRVREAWETSPSL